VAVMWKRAQGKKKVLSSVNWKERVFVLTPKTLNYFEGNYEVRMHSTYLIELNFSRQSSQQGQNIVADTFACSL